MRTPVRLAAALVKFRITSPSFANSGASPVYRWTMRFGESRLAVSSVEHALGGAEGVKSRAEAMAAQRKKAFRAAPWAKFPVLWLTGPVELLGQSMIPGLARALQDTGRMIFLETDGLQLRRRIHEFRPDARLYLTIRFYGMPETHDVRTQQPHAFARAVEGIRAAQLSGFLICVHIVIEAATEAAEINRLLQYLQTLHVDGVVITAAEGDDSADARNTLAACRRLIGNSWWAKFSKLVEDASSVVQRKAAASPEARRNRALSPSPAAAGLSPSHTSAISGEEAAAP
jgi:hypothetical protein